MITELPVYLQQFSCYQMRVQFAAGSEMEIPGKWAHQPSYALGDALMNSKKYNHLYHSIFKPLPVENIKDMPARIVIRADWGKRGKFKKMKFSTFMLHLSVIKRMN